MLCETENFKIKKNIQAEKQESTRTEYFTDQEETVWIVQENGNTKK